MADGLRAWGLLYVVLFVVGADGVLAANTTWCWGNGQHGALGSDMAGADSNQPAQVMGTESFTEVCTGAHHSCALDSSGKAFCWGGGTRGALGNGREDDSAKPVEVSGGHVFAAGSLGCGQDFTCALDSSRTLWCWGDASQGNFGNGESSRKASSVPTKAAMGINFDSVAVGAWHACGIQNDQRAYCWGKGTDGQLGGSVMVTYVYTPQEVSGGHRFKQLSAGSRLTCGIDVDDNAWCFGASTGLGDSQNYTDMETEPREPVPVAGNHSFALIAAGVNHACAIELEGSLWCWGTSLGNGNGQDTLKPMEITASQGPEEEDPPPPPLEPYVALSVGERHTCAIDSAQATWCFGAGRHGELGDGSFRDSLAPQRVAGEHKFLSLDSSVREGVPSHTCAIATAGSRVAPAPASAPIAATVSAPSSPIGTPASSSASAPIGAIIGGTAGAAVVFALMAVFAWRYGKRWLGHRQPILTGFQDCDSDKNTVKLDTSDIDTFWRSEDASGAPCAAIAVPMMSSHQAAADPTLSLITSVLASQPHHGVLSAGSASTAAGATATASGRSGSSGALELRTDAKLWEVQWSELNILRPIGKGSFGSVYLAEWNQTLVACKVLITKDGIERAELGLPDQVMHELQAEAAVMSRMRHPNVVQFMGLVAMPPVLITEYCSSGSLYDCLAAAREHPAAAAQLTWRRRLSMAIDGGTGLLYLHRRNIIHRDVKSPNLLVDQDWHIKLADFNLSRILEGAQPDSSLTAGGASNPIWLAPEILQGEKATAASDVYSFGLVLFELLTWRLPWTLAGMSPFKVGAAIRQGGRPEIPSRDALPGFDTATWAGLDDYVQLMRDCWAQQAGDRPTFDQAVRRLRVLLDAMPDD